MLSTTLVVAGLSTGHKVGLAVVGGLFIGFALVSSFVIPRRNPDFPGRSVGWYSALAVLFLVAMIGAVLVFGKEKPEAEAATGGGETTAQTSTQATTTAAGGGAAQGDAA